ncbi:MAG: hypothetical protein OHK0029_17770 [Armatimonadaceae bacterium]
MKASAETKLLLILGIIVLLGGGALVGLQKMAGIGEAPPTPPPPLEVNVDRFDELAKGARHMKGDPTAEVTVLEFADFQCPSCRRAFAGKLGENLKDPNRKFRFAFRHLPLEMHEFAEPAAIAAEAAARQGKFWEMYDALFTGEEATLSEEFIVEAARKAGLDMTQFAQDRKDPELKKLVEADKEAAVAAGVTYTPTFMIKDADGMIKSVVGQDDFAAHMEKVFNGEPAKPATGATDATGDAAPGPPPAPTE